MQLFYQSTCLCLVFSLMSCQKYKNYKKNKQQKVEHQVQTGQSIENEAFTDDPEYVEEHQAVSKAYAEHYSGTPEFQETAPSYVDAENFNCSSTSPPLVSYDKKKEKLSFCNHGHWTELDSETMKPVVKKIVKKQRKGEVGSFYCRKSEQFSQSFVCSRKDKIAKNSAKRLMQNKKLHQRQENHK